MVFALAQKGLYTGPQRRITALKRGVSGAQRAESPPPIHLYYRPRNPINTLMHILITNDDGISAPGINILSHFLVELGQQVTVVAPDRPRSGSAGRITTGAPIRLKQLPDSHNPRRYQCNGTPVDCVKLALNTIFKEHKPDLLLSGINHGRNEGICVHYSGTVCAAMEGAIAGVPAIALSRQKADLDRHFDHCLPFIKRLVEEFPVHTLAHGTLLNVNFPYDEPKGVRFARQATGYFMNEFVPSGDASGKPVYWMSGSQVDPSGAQDTDLYFLEQGYTTVSPIQTDLTNYAFLAEPNKFF